MSYRGFKHTKETRQKLSEAAHRRFLSKEQRAKVGRKGRPSTFQGLKHSEETKRFMSEKAKLRYPNGPFFGKKMSEESRAKLSARKIGWKMGDAQKQKRRDAWLGSKNPRWNPDYPYDLKMRRSSEYLEWRSKVFERDRYQCVECGDARGGNLQADHIKPYAAYPDLRFDIDNGRTLCVECHKKTPTWGRKTKRDRQAEEVCV